MNKNTIITVIALIIILLAGLSAFFLTKLQSRNYSSESNSGNEMKMDADIKMTDNLMTPGMAMSMSDSVKDDQSFIENMIPHHVEAVTSSKEILASTTDLELKTFAQNTIDTQTKEIDEMKTWYKDWFGKEYVPNNSYQAMMGGMKGKTGIELDKEYIKDMVSHHQGAIEMANKIKTITKRPELLQLANDIISIQTNERNQLMDWAMNKYGDHTMMNM